MTPQQQTQWQPPARPAFTCMDEHSRSCNVVVMILLGDFVTIAVAVVIALNFVNEGGCTSARPYPLNRCLVTDESFERGTPYLFVHAGQEIKLCCKNCLARFKADPQQQLAKLNAPK